METNCKSWGTSARPSLRQSNMENDLRNYPCHREGYSIARRDTAVERRRAAISPKAEGHWFVPSFVFARSRVQFTFRGPETEWFPQFLIIHSGMTNFMQRSPSETASSGLLKILPTFYRSRMFITVLSPLLFPMLSQMTPIHIILFYLNIIYFNIIH
jgi:hypothetical protein